MADQSASSLIKSNLAKCRVSSVLNKDKTYAKEHMFDDEADTCWYSHQGKPQSILLEFTKPCHVSELQIKFQGGFVGQDGQIWIATENGSESSESLSMAKEFFPTDDNNLQKFEVDLDHVKKMKIVFPESTDFYGRIIVYSLDVLGYIH